MTAVTAHMGIEEVLELADELAARFEEEDEGEWEGDADEDWEEEEEDWDDEDDEDWDDEDEDWDEEDWEEEVEEEEEF